MKELKEKLLNVLSNSYENSTYVYSEATEHGKDLIIDICRNSSKLINREELIKLVEDNQIFKSINRIDERIIIGDKGWIYTNCINSNYKYNTDGTEGFIRVECNINKNYHVYIKVDEDKNTATFKLGNKEKTLNLSLYSGFCWKPSGNNLLINTIDDFKRNFTCDLFSKTLVKVGRSILRIRTVI